MIRNANQNHTHLDFFLNSTDLLQRGGPSDDGGEFTSPLIEVGVPFA